MIDNETLQTFFFRVFLIRFQAQRLGTCLALRTLFPSYFRTFVTTHMDIFRREDFNQFSIYILEEFQYLIISGTKHVFRYSPLSPYFVRTTGTTQLRISGKGSLHMSRKVYFRNNGYVTFCSIFYNFFCLFLRIESTVRFTVILTGVASDDGFRSIGTDFCQLRVFLDFQTPSLVVRDMPMQTVHVVQCLHIDVSLYFIYREEMTAGIEMGATITKTGSVFDFYGREGYICSHSNRQRFTQRLDTIKYSGFRRTGNGYSVTGNFQLIGFRILIFCPQSQDNGIFSFCSGLNGKVFSRSRLQIIGQEFRIALHLLVSFRIENLYSAFQDKGGSLLYNDFLRQGNYLIISFLLN